MDNERTLQGYCRTTDQARIVFCEKDDVRWNPDCQYDQCIYRESCPIGQQITLMNRNE